MKPSIVTERTVLRPFRESDAEDLYRYASSEKVGPMAGWKPHANLAESRGILKMFIDAGEVWAIELKENGRVVGSIGLHTRARANIDFDYELGYVLAEEYWGKGIMPECCNAVLNYAFTKCGAKTVICCRFPFNTQSERVIEKLGFTYLTHLPASWKRYDGVILDEEVYSLKKIDFMRKKLGYMK